MLAGSNVPKFMVALAVLNLQFPTTVAETLSGALPAANALGAASETTYATSQRFVFTCFSR
jgi:hypothetical protein